MELEEGIIPVPETYTQLRDSDAKIYVFSGSDHEVKLREKLDVEWDNVPLINRRYERGEDADGQNDMSNRIILVYISSFFTDECDFLYYVKGGVNMSRFLQATFSGKPYDRPCFATPVTVHTVDNLFHSEGLNKIQFEEASKTDTKGLRWKYLYESGVRAWESLEYSGEKLAEIKMMDELLREGGELSDGTVWSDIGLDEDMEQAALSDTEAESPSTALGFEEDLKEAAVRSDSDDMAKHERVEMGAKDITDHTDVEDTMMS